MPADCELACVVASLKGRSSFTLNTNETKSGYDTGLADSVQGATAVEETVVIIQIQMRGNAVRAPIAGWLFR